jgi:uncharacterized Zn finger protein (UPF0148 family)
MEVSVIVANLTCPVCQKPFVSRYGKQYCSTTCSKKKWTEDNKEKVKAYQAEYKKKEKK